ncbi:DUF262 domain-containing protein [Brachyspira innocens]|uniref:DUF262 domain-containing protein n=1 Tax=Brachyspira innocens TaxID=13264 RepID=UPI0026F1F511|nr:DUF262 domain-containing protein [Brachyspira innocens]
MGDENKIYISDLNNYSFYIPNYQRGYKWSKKNIEDLLNDINSIDNDNKKDHCLHNLTIIKNGEEYEVVDGQQRLTTIFLLLKYLDPEEIKIYNLDYQIREETKHFINNKLETIINDISNYDNGTAIFKSVKDIEIYIEKEDGTIEKSSYNKQDIYFICDVLFYMHQWFKSNENNNICSNIQKVYFYKHELEGIKGETVFANLNSGRVPLTDIELIKADLIINISEGKSNNDIKINELRRDIGRKWDEIENWFSKDEVWYWIAPKNKNTNKISLLFSLLLDSFKNTKNKKYIDMYELYLEYVNWKIDNGHKNVYESIWEEIHNYYLRIKDIYENTDLYHLVGIAIIFKINLEYIIDLCINKQKDVLKNILKTKIRDKLGIKNSSDYKLEIENIFNDKYYCREYREYINNLFLLLNCLEGYNFINKSFNDNFKYRFDLHNKENWSIEHILPQKITLDNALVYMEALKYYINEDEEIPKNIKDNFNLIYDNYDNKKTDDISHIIEQLGFMHQMGNLVLLDNSTNKSLTNNPFDKKREIILKLLLIDNKFIPPLTCKIFTKSFENAELNKTYWSPKDFNSYMTYQKEKLINFISTID